MDYLARALRETGKAVCVREASRLEKLSASTSELDLHLRNATLDVQDALNIAQALRASAAQSRVAIRSFSVSYNPELQDAGIATLIKALPSTVTELGVVGCEIGDVGGDILLVWAQSAPELRMICLEQNQLSNEMRQRFLTLGKQRSDLLVVV